MLLWSALINLLEDSVISAQKQYQDVATEKEKGGGNWEFSDFLNCLISLPKHIALPLFYKSFF